MTADFPCAPPKDPPHQGLGGTGSVLSKPMEEFPEYWLAQIECIANLERAGDLTRAQMVKRVHDILRSRKVYAAGQRYRLMQAATKGDAA